MNNRRLRNIFIEICEDLIDTTAGYNYMVSETEWRRYISNLQAKFNDLKEGAKKAPESPNLPSVKQTRIDFYSNLERGIGLYSQRPEIMFELAFVYLVQEWQRFLNEISQWGYDHEKGKYCKKFGLVKETLGITSFPPELEWKTRLYTEVRNNLQHSRWKLRQSDLNGLGVNEFELLYKLDGTRKKYKVGDTVVITAATAFEAGNDFIIAARLLVP